LILIVALAIRMIIVFNQSPWTDNYLEQAKPILNHQNIYSETHKVFPYSPVSMFLPAACVKISDSLNLPFHMVMRFPSVLADVCIALAIFVGMAKIGMKRAFLWGMFYALNLLSILITAFHGNVISIATLFSFLSSVVLLENAQKNYRLSALLLGVGIGFRSYPVLLLPLFLLKLPVSRTEKIKYLLYSTVPTALSFIPFFILDFSSVLKEVFAYSGFTDFGIAAIIRAVLSFKYKTLLFGFPPDWYNILSSITKPGFFVIYFVILFLTSKRKMVASILSTFLAFYCIYSGISAQYFIWILPFAFLIRDPMLKYFLFLSTWALTSFYWVYHPHIIFGRFEPMRIDLNVLLASQILSLSILLGFCLIWMIKILAGKEKNHDLL